MPSFPRHHRSAAISRSFMSFLVMAAAVGHSVASGVPNSAASPAKTDSPAAPAASAMLPAAASADINPLDRVRQRLAEKLGAQGSSKGTNPEPPVVRIVNKSQPEPTRAADSLASEATRQPHGKPSLQNDALAAKLAAAHRASRSHEPPSSAAAAVVGAPIGGRLAAAVHAPHWDYLGEGGPETWGAMRPEFAACGNGTRQSPIDIREGLRLDLEPIRFDYVPSAIRVIDNGHTVQVNVGSGSGIEVMGRRFELVQFHFHRPSEERVDGRRFDMVVHLVHKDPDGKLAVVAVLLNRGAAQPLIQTVWNNLPLEKGMDQPVRSPVDLNALLPQRRDYFTYMGSLTTPPCTEGVLWMVMKTPVEVSPEQIGIFSRLYPMNARPLQAAGGRMINESN